MSLRANLVAKAAALEKRLAAAVAKKNSQSRSRDLAQYHNDPVGYAKDVLGLDLWQAQREAAEMMLKPPYRVLLRSGNSIGKTFFLAAICSWFFDTRTVDSMALTTATTWQQVKNGLWREIRIQRERAGLGGFIGPEAPILRTSKDHIAIGFTAHKIESFHGFHPRHMLIIFDEATGIEAAFYDAAKSMFQATGEHYWLAAFNPLATSSAPYAEELNLDTDGNPLWHSYGIDSRKHPNILAELDNRPAPYPAAVRLSQFNDWVSSWCEPVDSLEAMITDFEWPPCSEKWWRPGPEMEARGLGRWPSSATFGVWSDAAWQSVVGETAFGLGWKWGDLPVIGHDPARHGNDYSAFHVRAGAVSLHHERHNGWETKNNASRCKELAREWGNKYNMLRPRGVDPIDPRTIPIHIDGDGLGAGVVDLADGYRFISVCGSSRAIRPSYYQNRRSENWFVLVEKAKQGILSLAKLPRDVAAKLRIQFMAPEWGPDAAGRCCVEPKIIMKKRLGYSPDDADACILAHLPVQTSPLMVSQDNMPHVSRLKPDLAQEPELTRRPMFGR